MKPRSVALGIAAAACASSGKRSQPAERTTIYGVRRRGWCHCHQDQEPGAEEMTCGLC